MGGVWTGQAVEPSPLDNANGSVRNLTINKAVFHNAKIDFAYANDSQNLSFDSITMLYEQVVPVAFTALKAGNASAVSRSGHSVRINDTRISSTVEQAASSVAIQVEIEGGSALIDVEEVNVSEGFTYGLVMAGSGDGTFNVRGSTFKSPILENNSSAVFNYAENIMPGAAEQ